jgi:N-methylhydantoinase B
MNATALAVQCLQAALAATPAATGDGTGGAGPGGVGAGGIGDDQPRLYAGPSGQAALANHSWSYTTSDGHVDGWVLSEAFQPGSSGGAVHDGSDLFANLVGAQHVLDFIDVEITEAWYPLRVLEKTAASGPYGAGRHRSGAGCRMAYTVSGDERLTGAMFAMRETLPIGGVAGGLPGAPTEFHVRRADGTDEVLDAHAAGATLGPGEVFTFQAGSGGGFGDPLDRDAEAVWRDVRTGRLSPEQAEATYGVVGTADGVDAAATAVSRDRHRTDRLARARPPVRPPAPTPAAHADHRAPLYHGVERRGAVAVAVESGARLAVAPDHWTDGCPVLEEERSSARGVPWLLRTYLDPDSGRALAAEAVPIGAPRSFTSAPAHWIRAAASGTAGAGVDVEAP